MLFFGDKTQALFDVWSLEHFVSGMATVIVIRWLCEHFLPEIYKNPTIPDKKKTISLLLTYLAAVYLWEALEFYLEAGYTNNEAVTHWFRGVEFWGNRLITDPVITTTGGYLGYRYARIAPYARVFSITWLLIHIFVFPDCMYLQDYIEKTFF